MRRKWLIPVALAAVFILIATAVPEEDTEAELRASIHSLGYETEGRAETEWVSLPVAADKVWASYLALQSAEGFPLAAYSGRTVLKYTFKITNHPFHKEVFAHLYWADGQILGGDIMSPAIDGFLSGLSSDLL